MAIPIQTSLNWLQAISREEAAAEGKKRFFTGEPCKHGHIAERFVSTAGCAECIGIRQKQAYKTNPARAIAYTRKWQKANPPTPEAAAERQLRKRKARAERQQKNPQFWRAYNAARARKLRERKRIEMAGRSKPEICEICGEKGQIHFDHCHQTNKFRGWICERCNLVLGKVKDSSNLLRQLAQYLDPQAQ